MAVPGGFLRSERSGRQVRPPPVGRRDAGGGEERLEHLGGVRPGRRAASLSVFQL